ncbi:MAG TPA: hypothetical protein VGA29_07580 [Ignavibacteriaceae bacterium]
MKTDKFIQGAVKKPGSLSRQLGIPVKEKIPISLLDKIIHARAGQIITNPTKMGKKRVKVTKLLERRAILARTLKKLRR